MKKSILIIAAVTALVACSNNDTFKEVATTDTVIGFSTYTSKQTRAENSTNEDKDNLEAYNTNFKVWGYKNIYVNADPNNTNEYVFGHIVGENETTYPGTVVTYNTTDQDWEYFPLRFWDKSANYYRFFAASPANKSWKWNKSNDKIKLEDFTIKGQNRVLDGTGAFGVLNSTSNNDGSALLMSDVNDEDLMISDDILKHITYTSDEVNLLFNHILSRLNIGIRRCKELDDYIVKLNSLEIHNMVKKATFDENTTLTTSNAGIYVPSTISEPTAAQLLKYGTAARWIGNVRFTSNEMKYYVANQPLSIESIEPASGTSTYDFVFQGLVIPQVVNYTKTIEAVSTETGFKMDGSNASTDSDPYIVLDYEIWTKDHSTETYAATDPEVIGGIAAEGDHKPASYKLDGYKYFYNLADVFNGNIAAANKTDITFCEGWQNTLLITIKPTAINFDAQVYRWADNAEVPVDIEQ